MRLERGRRGEIVVYDGIRDRLLIGCVEDVAQVVQMYNLKRKCGVRDMCGV